MASHRFGSLLLLLLVVGLFVSGTVYVFAVRFESGDVYPPYSSYRSDPLGTRAFYECLGRLPGVRAGRNTGSPEKWTGMNGSTLFLVGVRRNSSGTVDRSWAEAVEKVSREGGRIVIAFVPQPESEGKARPTPERNKGKARDEPRGKQKDPREVNDPDVLSRSSAAPPALWGIRTGRLSGHQGVAQLVAKGTGLPSSLYWHGTLALEPADGTGWRVIYAKEGKPVVLERTGKKGGMVLLADSFPLSNEAMKEHRSSALLAWLCGRHDRIVFDETHLGTSDTPGISGLLRKEGLAPFFVSLIVLALLAIWWQSAPFVPPPPDDRTGEVETGRTHRTGMTNLLRRNVPPGEILGVCLAEWERSLDRGTENLTPLVPEIRAIVAEEQNRSKKTRSPVQAYRKASALVSARRRGKK